MRLFHSFINSVIKQRRFLIVLIVILTGISAGLTVTNLKVDNSLSIWFLNDNLDYKEYIKFQETQGSDEIIIALIPVEDGLAEKSIGTLNILHKHIDSLHYVNATFSLANAKYPVYSNKNITYHSIYNAKRSKKSINGLLDKMPTVKKQLITENGENLLFYIQLKPIPKIKKIREEAVSNIEKIIHRITNGHVAISGSPVLNEAYNRTVSNETIFFAVLTVLAILICLFLLLSNPFYILAAFLSIVIPISFLFGFISILGYKLNLILMLIPTVLMVYCLSDAIHIIMMYDKYQKKHPNESKTTHIKNALYKSLKPCFYTTLTTSIGYFALYLSPLPAFKSMSIFASLGLSSAFVLVYIIIVIVFSFDIHKVSKKKQGVLLLKNINMQPLLKSLNSFTTNFSKSIIIIASVVFIIGVYAATKVEVNTDALDMLGNGKEKSDLALIEEALQGSTRLQLNITSKNQNPLLTNEVFKKLKIFQSKLDSSDLLSSPVSLLNVKSFLEKRTVLFQSNIPKNMDSLFLKSKKESNGFFSLFSNDFSSLGISVNIKELKTKELELLLTEIKNDFESSFETTDFTLKIQGFSYVYSKLNNFILQTQFRSFLMAFVVSFLVLFIFIGNLKVTILALIPNLFPIAILAITMMILKIPLDVSTAMIAPIMLGISMDDTIHLIYSYKNNSGNKNPIVRINKSTLYTGKALVITTLILTIGFLIIGFSAVNSVSNFGLLCAFTISGALLADIIFLPALIKFIK